jgi:hypothetical protein
VAWHGAEQGPKGKRGAIMNKQSFFGGIPTEPDIRKLRETFRASEMFPGKTINYDDVSKIINTPANSSRFKTVTNRWRKLVEQEDGLIIGTVPGEGFKVLDEAEKLNLSVSKLKGAGRLSRRSYMVASRIDRKCLDDDELCRLDHVSARSSAILAAAQIKKTVVLPTIGGDK